MQERYRDTCLHFALVTVTFLILWRQRVSNREIGNDMCSAALLKSKYLE